MAVSMELKEALKRLAEKIAQYVEDVAELTVETRYVEMGATGSDDSKLAARTVLKLDADSEVVLPMEQGEKGLEVNAAVFELHQQSVQSAIDYRTRMMESLLSILRGG